jgi:hypothetical protein
MMAGRESAPARNVCFLSNGYGASFVNATMLST